MGEIRRISRFLTESVSWIQLLRGDLMAQIWPSPEHGTAWHGRSVQTSPALVDRAAKGEERLAGDEFPDFRNDRASTIVDPPISTGSAGAPGGQLPGIVERRTEFHHRRP
jgi:hypothetical protein